MTDPLDREIRTDIDMQVVARDGSVHILFNEEDHETKSKRPAFTSNFIMPAKNALDLSKLLADLAFEADTGLKIPGAQKQELVNRHRATLLNRLTIVLNDKREQKKMTNRALAQLIVDIASREIFV